MTTYYGEVLDASWAMKLKHTSLTSLIHLAYYKHTVPQRAVIIIIEYDMAAHHSF